MRGRSPSARALLLLGGATALVASAATCGEGTTSYPEYVASAFASAATTVLYGGGIGARSDGCRLPVSPSARTFQIWSYIYGHLQLLSSAPMWMSDEERYHIVQANDATTEWYDSFVADDAADNAKAVAAIDKMLCHVARARERACATAPNRFKCCSFAQYESWLHHAKLLSELILARYGRTCGAPLESDDATLARYSRAAADVLRRLPEGGPGDAAGRAARTTAAWALRGVCENRNAADDACTALVNGTGIERALADVDALRRQSDVAFWAALTCVPDATTQ